jgi:hypothetical protein
MTRGCRTSSNAPGQQAYRFARSPRPDHQGLRRPGGGRHSYVPPGDPGSRRRQGHIGLARTWLAVDAHGKRGIVEFNINNISEQYLEIQLPPSAQLWTAIVRYEPVKPVVPPNQQPGVVRIPLVKAALGEGDYKITLKYGGRLGASANCRGSTSR